MLFAHLIKSDTNGLTIDTVFAAIGRKRWIPDLPVLFNDNHAGTDSMTVLTIYVPLKEVFVNLEYI